MALTQAPKIRLFVILFAAGIIGVLSLLLFDFSAIVALLPPQPNNPLPVITFPFKLLALIQPTVLLALAVFAGVNLARKVGLAAPFAEAIAQRSDAIAALKPQLWLGVIGGLSGGILIVVIALGFKQFLSPETSDRLSKFNWLLPIPTRFLYGGVTEELLLRWGFMTLLLWLAWRIFQRRRSIPSASCVVGSILVSALTFGAGHLPIAFLLIPHPGFAVVVFVLLANSVFGVIAGFLYWKKGLESAMIAHMLAHVVILIAMYAGV